MKKLTITLISVVLLFSYLWIKDRYFNITDELEDAAFYSKPTTYASKGETKEISKQPVSKISNSPKEIIKKIAPEPAKVGSVSRPVKSFESFKKKIEKEESSGSSNNEENKIPLNKRSRYGAASPSSVISDRVKERMETFRENVSKYGIDRPDNNEIQERMEELSESSPTLFEKQREIKSALPDYRAGGYEVREPVERDYEVQGEPAEYVDASDYDLPPPHPDFEDVEIMERAADELPIMESEGVEY